ncbi:diguanylate cyclase [Alteromonas sp. A081]|uniref:GGDEF domain-containing response regulator n=1 Tax=Alteromonas sp. A081 TaxID=3410269 RepID=UPI003B981AE0
MPEQDYTTIELPSVHRRTLSECCVLVVDDEKSSRLVLTSVIEEFTQCYEVDDSCLVFETCEDIRPDLILLDVNMPRKDGLTLCRQLKRDTRFVDIPVIFITGSAERDVQDRCWEAGGADFIEKPIIASTLTHRVKNALQNTLRLSLLKEFIFHDQLTELYNRHYLAMEVPLLLKQAMRNKEFFSVIMFDIDYFKGYNDTYGHIEGDSCLKLVSNTLVGKVNRPQDCVVRYGGEEFLVILPYTYPNECMSIGCELIGAVNALAITNEASPLGKVTVSAGFSSCQTSQNTSIEQLIEEADRALFEAKSQGKNRLCG